MPASYGFDGSLDEAKWAQLCDRRGDRPGLFGSVTLAGVAGTRLVQVTAAGGSAYGIGWAASTENIALTANTSGSARWDLIVADVNWSGVGGSVTYAAKVGTSTYSTTALPTLLDTPGTRVEVPIGWVQVPDSASSLIGTPTVPLWQVPSVITTGATPPGSPRLGQHWCDGVDFYRFSGSGWLNLTDPEWQTPTTYPLTGGPSAGGATIGIRRRGGMLELRGAIAASGTPWAAQSGLHILSFSPSLTAGLSASNPPQFLLAGEYTGTAVIPVRGVLRADGQLRITIPSTTSKVYLDSVAVAARA